MVEPAARLGNGTAIRGGLGLTADAVDVTKRTQLGARLLTDGVVAEELNEDGWGGAVGGLGDELRFGLCAPFGDFSDIYCVYIEDICCIKSHDICCTSSIS